MTFFFYSGNPTKTEYTRNTCFDLHDKNESYATCCSNLPKEMVEVWSNDGEVTKQFYGFTTVITT